MSTGSVEIAITICGHTDMQRLDVDAWMSEYGMGGLLVARRQLRCGLSEHAILSVQTYRLGVVGATCLAQVCWAVKQNRGQRERCAILYQWLGTWVVMVPHLQKIMLTVVDFGILGSWICTFGGGYADANEVWIRCAYALALCQSIAGMWKMP